MQKNLTLILAGMLLLAACGDDDSKSGNNANNTANNTTNNATNNATNNTSNNTSNNTANNTTNNANNTTNNANNTTNNANNTANNTTNNATNNNSGSCDVNGFAMTVQEFDGSRYLGEYASLEVYSAEMVPADVMYVEFIETDGAPFPLTAPGTYPLGMTAADQNYETCNTCVLLLKDCTQDTCAGTYFATAGAIEVDSVDLENDVIAGRLVGIVAEEVTIDWDTYISTPVANGKSWCIADAGFDTTPECIADTDCTDASKPICSSANVCVGCASTFDCKDPGAPVCGADPNTGDAACLAGAAACANDDANEDDDGPAAAKALTSGTPFNGGICEGADSAELDWFKISVTQTSTVTVTLTAPTVDLDVYLYDADGYYVDSAETDGTNERFVTGVDTPGDYYVIVVPYDTQDVGSGLEAAPYTLTATVAAAECMDDAACNFDAARPACDAGSYQCVGCITDANCTTAGAPVCVDNGVDPAGCASYDECTGDDQYEPNSDGRAGATEISVGATIAAKICGDFATDIGYYERDWYKFTAPADGNYRVTLNWTVADMANPDPDLDLYIYNDMRTYVDSSTISYPEVGEIMTATTGSTYYISVRSYDSSTGAAANDYTVLVESF